MRKFDWILAILKINWLNMVAHRKVFYTMIIVLCMQNLIQFSLWVIVFSKISSLKGWGLSEVAFLISSSVFGYGLFFSLFGGINQLGHTIHNGELDIYLTRPRPTLLLALFQRMRADSMGDMLTGIIILVFFVKPSLQAVPLFLILSISVGMVFASFRLISHTLAFWGHGAEASENNYIAFLITATSPQKGFTQWLKILLLTIFPAGYIGLLPVEIMRNFRWEWLALQLLGTGTLFAFSLWLFSCGLKRYTSSNNFVTLR